METPEEAAKRIFGQRASYYTTSATHTDPRVLERVAALCRPEQAGSVLDIGTGAGHTAFALAPFVASVVGVDLTPQMLAEAKNLRSARSITNLSFCVADAHTLPFPDGSFHRVTCRRTAHHFSDIGRALQEIRRILPAGGRLIVDDRSVPEDDFVDACMNELDRYHDESHIRQYRPTEWRRMLRTAGFAVEAVEPYIQHRPLTSLTDGVSPENVQHIHNRLNGLNAQQRKKLSLAEKDEQLYSNHWYVTIAAVKQEDIP